MPSDNYKIRFEVFERLFGSTIDQYIQPTGLTGYKLVSGVPEDQLKPYYTSPFPQRAKNSGEPVIYLAEKPEIASCEIFGNPNYSGAPPNTWCLEYKYQGQMLNIAKVPDDNFKAQFLQWSGEKKHEFSQDFKHYLTEKGFTSKCDSVGWESVSGQRLSEPGFVFAWHSGVSGDFFFIGKQKVA